jgi:hypothetical protein
MILDSKRIIADSSSTVLLEEVLCTFRPLVIEVCVVAAEMRVSLLTYYGKAEISALGHSYKYSYR